MYCCDNVTSERKFLSAGLWPQNCPATRVPITCRRVSYFLVSRLNSCGNGLPKTPCSHECTAVGRSRRPSIGAKRGSRHADPKPKHSLRAGAEIAKNGKRAGVLFCPHRELAGRRDIDSR